MKRILWTKRFVLVTNLLIPIFYWLVIVAISTIRFIVMQENQCCVYKFIVNSSHDMNLSYRVVRLCFPCPCKFCIVCTFICSLHAFCTIHKTLTHQHIFDIWTSESSIAFIHMHCPFSSLSFYSSCFGAEIKQSNSFVLTFDTVIFFVFLYFALQLMISSSLCFLYQIHSIVHHFHKYHTFKLKNQWQIHSIIHTYVHQPEFLFASAEEVKRKKRSRARESTFGSPFISPIQEEIEINWESDLFATF